MIPTQEIISYIKSGQKYQAMRLAEKSMCLSFNDAKKYVEDLEQTVLRDSKQTPRSNRRYTITSVDGMDGHDFEYFCAEILKKSGFIDVSVTPGSGDQGVDILATKDGIKYAIQCKNYSSTLGNTPIQEVSAGKLYYGCHVGVVMTNSTFTSSATQLATATNILLWDRIKLENMISQIGGYEVLKQYLPADSSDDYTEEDESFFELEPEVGIEPEPKPVPTNAPLKKYSRRVMYIISNICFGWSIICLLVGLVALLINMPQVISVGFGEGSFVVVLGLMFRILSKSKKEEKSLQLLGISIKKPWFVFACILLAYVFLFIFVFPILEVTPA